MGGFPDATTLLKEGSANTHLTHLEELVLTQGPEGYKMARAFLLELLETLKGNSKSHVHTSVKWDGAPAIFAGINPENGKFFVGTKSIFNKVPKINYTEEDIINNHGHAPGLVDKLTKALKYLPELGIQKILQGDFMFDDEMLDVVEIDGEPHYRFKPNTIIYAVPVNSDIGREIGQSKFGIVFHTTYDSLDSGASFGADVSNLNRAPGIWFDDAFFTDDTGTVTLTENEERRVISLVEKADAVNEKIDYNDLPFASLNIYINREIKAGQFLEDPESSFGGFKRWYTERSKAAADKLKTPAGRQRRLQKLQQGLELFDNKKEDILNLFRVSRLLFEAKNIFIEKYNNAVYNTKHFVDDGSGDLIATNPEGYVAVDHAGNGIKFVDRLEFSRANFMVDKSDKFTQESIKRLSKSLTIDVSKDTKITKTIQEWLDEMKGVGHIPGAVPFLVYNDLLNGALVVETVRQEDAQEVIYNTVYEYAKNFLQEAFEIEIIEDEDEDPVVDSEFTPQRKKTLAIVPGAFKPPHQGHADMVQEYANIADKVIILISKPTKKGRYLDDGAEILQSHAKKIWEDVFLPQISGAEIEIDTESDFASPIQAAYDYIGPKGPLDPNAYRVILGASDKPDDNGVPDWHRWKGVQGSKNVKPGLEIMDIEENAVPCTARACGTPFSATTMRELIGELRKDPNDPKLRNALSEFIPKEKINDLLAIFPLKENSMSAGAVGGYSGPLSTSGKKKEDPEDNESIIRHENIDLSLVEEVLELIIGRGV